MEPRHSCGRQSGCLTRHDEGAVAFAAGLLGGDGENDNRVGGGAVADPRFPTADAEAALDQVGAGREQFGMGADLGLRNCHGQRAAGPLHPLGIGAEGKKVAEDKLPPAPDAGYPEQAGTFHQRGFHPGDGSVVGREL